MRATRLSKRAIRRLGLLSIFAVVLLYFNAATWIERRKLDEQRSMRPNVEAAAATPLDAQSLMATVGTLASPEYEGRGTGSPGAVKARTWIADRFKSIGLEPMIADGYLQRFSFTRTSIKGLVDPDKGLKTTYEDEANVVGMCKGSSGAAPVLVVSAHYDHLGRREGVIYPGADDNASGVAVVLAIAEQCHRRPFRHDVLFVAFDAEELGLQGARAFIANPPVPLARLALDVNLDMVSRSDKRELFVAGPYHWPQLKPVLDAVARRSRVVLLFGHDKPASIAGRVDDWTHASDHGPFHDAKIPFVYFGVEDHPDYHQPTDTVDKIDPSFLRESAETILDAVTALDEAMPFRQ